MPEEQSGSGNEKIYLDLDEGLKRVLGNAKLYVKLLAKFKDNANLPELLDAVEAGDYEKAQNLAHTMKGITANLSLKELYVLTQEFEAQIKNKSVDPHIVEEVKTCFAETMVHVDRIIEQYGG